MREKNDRFFRRLLAGKKMRLTCALSCVFAFSVLFCACSYNIDSMMEDYNGHFIVTEKIVHALGPGDEGWTPSMMLYDEYFLYDDGMLILAAPEGSTNITWTFSDPNNKYSTVAVVVRAGKDSNGNVVYYRGEAYHGETLIMYVPETGLESPKTYQLQLTITDQGGSEYTDKCGIVIYQRYDR